MMQRNFLIRRHLKDFVILLIIWFLIKNLNFKIFFKTDLKSKKFSNTKNYFIGFIDNL